MQTRGGIVWQAPEAARIHIPRPNAVAIAIFGFSLQGNLYVPTFHLPFIRLSDMMVVILAPVFFAMAKPEVRERVMRGVLLFAPVILSTLLFKSNEGADRILYMPAMYMFYFVVGSFLIYQFLEDPAMLDLFCWSQLAGFGLAAVAAMLSTSQGAAMLAVGMKVPLTAIASERSQIASTVKIGGLWPAGNEAGNVFAVAGAAAIHLAVNRKKLLVYFAYIAVLLLTFIYTANRAGLITPMIGLVIVIALSGWRGWISALGCALLAVAVGCALFPDVLAGLVDQVAKRTVNDSYSSENAHERSQAFVIGAELMFRHPFGIFFTQRMREFSDMSGGVLQSPHNMFLSLAYQIGIAGPVLLLGGYARLLFFKPNMTQVARTYILCAALMALPSMFFEELDHNPVFQHVITLLFSALLCFPSEKAQWVTRARAPRRVAARSRFAEAAARSPSDGDLGDATTPARPTEDGARDADVTTPTTTEPGGKFSHRSRFRQ